MGYPVSDYTAILAPAPTTRPVPHFLLPRLAAEPAPALRPVVSGVDVGERGAGPRPGR